MSINDQQIYPDQDTNGAATDTTLDVDNKEKWVAPKLRKYDTKNETLSGVIFNPDGPSYS
jgi:hypothetical protein